MKFLKKSNNLSSELKARDVPDSFEKCEMNFSEKTWLVGSEMILIMIKFWKLPCQSLSSSPALEGNLHRESSFQYTFSSRIYPRLFWNSFFYRDRFLKIVFFLFPPSLSVGLDLAGLDINYFYRYEFFDGCFNSALFCLFFKYLYANRVSV